MAAMTKKAEEIPLSLTSIAARDAEMYHEPSPGTIGDSTTVEESKSNCPLMRRDTAKDR